MNMNIVFRVDASEQMGTGHVMRCLTLAKQLRNKQPSVRITFICRELKGHLIPFIQQQNIHVQSLKPIGTDVLEWDWYKSNWMKDCYETKMILAQQSVDIMIVDHYGLDKKWEQRCKKMVSCLMVIDDMANREHDCHLLLDQNIQDRSDRYKGLVPKDCQLLLGTDYCLLRDEFIKLSDDIKVREGPIKNILVFFSGTDPHHWTAKTIKVLQKTHLHGAKVHVVVGAVNPDREEIERLCESTSNFNYYYKIDFMAQLMNQADVAIGAGGTTSWERAYVGLPSLTVIMAENQIELTRALEEKGASICLGSDERIMFQQLRERLLYLLANPQVIQDMSEKALKLINKEIVSKYPIVNILLEGRR